MQPSLHGTPRGREVVLEQVRITGLALRREALVVAVVLAIVSVPIFVDIANGTAGTWFDSSDWVPLGVISLLFPFAMWRGEKRFAPSFFWTLPVDRRKLALTRVFAGWVWLMVALAIFFCWHRGLALLSGVAGAETTSLMAFPGTTTFYLFGSAFVLGLRHPLRWFLGTFGVFFLLASLNEAVGRTPEGHSRLFMSSSFLRWIAYGPYGIDTLLDSKALQSVLNAATRGVIPTFFWLAAGLAVLWAAASRHGERRRH
ncbi:MAG TPA: hypothetical protein VM733_10585 [Thermoanaerobaculia bacterium]|nr:hypothetical protein [Thermoanaerobaculia bacterium]